MYISLILCLFNIICIMRNVVLPEEWSGWTFYELLSEKVKQRFSSKRDL